MRSEKITIGSPEYRRLSLAMLMAGLATFAVFYCVQPLLPLFSEQFGINAEEASLVVSLTIGPMAIALLVAGAVSDRVGRRGLMIGSLCTAAALALLTPLAPNWETLLALRLLVGLALAGVPAVAMTYIVEEVDDGAVSHAMGLYIAGTATGGMAGRLLGGLIADIGGWRVAMASIGVLIAALALLFWRLTPRSMHFVPRAISAVGYREGLARLWGDRVVPWLFAEAVLLMGAFVSLFNYISYRLLAPPYALSQTVVGAIFLLYIIGSVSSAWSARLAGRVGAHRVLWLSLVIFLGGIVLSMAGPLFLVIAGIAILTAGFFGAHSICSAWVGRRAGADRAQAAALYLFFYYVGGSIFGSMGGFAWTHGGWTGVALYSGGLVAIGTLIAFRLAWTFNRLA